MSGSLTRELFRRRVPQFLGVYLAAGWGALEFTDFLVNRYVLSPHLTDVVLLAWALLVPSILMVAWQHGAPGRDEWTRTEQIGIPVNLAIAAVILIVVFGGKELGAATESVTLEDETGGTVERVVPKSEFRKSLATYYFDNVSGDSALDWLQYGIPWAFGLDLEQDLFLDVRGTDALMSRLREEGAGDGLRVSFSLKRELAERLHLAHFIAGEISGNSSELVISTRLYETRRGKLVEERSFTGTDIFSLVDEMSLQLKHDLGLPAQHIEDTKDLPVSELLTNSLLAYRSFVDGVRAGGMNNDHELAAKHLETAVAEDPEFALAHLLLFSAYFGLNKIEEAEGAMETAVSLLYKLPERTQLEARTAYYWVVKQDFDKALTAAGMHAELFPQDVEVHEALAQLHLQKDDKARAIAAFERVLELDPERIDVLIDVGDVYESQGRFDLALQQYARYAAEAPTDPASFTTLGDLQRSLGKHEEAREQYEKALVIDPDNFSALLKLGQLEADVGQFDRALAYYDQALDAAVTPEQRAGANQSIRDYYEYRGQPNRAIEYLHAFWRDLAEYASPFLTLQLKLQSLGTYVAAGRTEVALDSLSTFARQLSPPFDLFVPLGQADIYLEKEDADSLEIAIEGIERFIEGFQFDVFRPTLMYLQGRAFEIKGAYEQALVSYQRSLELNPRGIEIHVDIGRCFRTLGRLDEAEDHLRRALEIRPSHPEAHYEMALVHLERNDRSRAIAHLESALSVWEEADPVFRPAAEARAKYAELIAAS